MSSLLRLRVDAAWPAETTRCEWAVFDARDNLLQRGESDPQHWPPADRCELVLAADQCLVLDAQLPKGVKGDDSKLVGYLVEDRLISDVQSEHIVAGRVEEDGAARVWVISRARLSAVLGALKQLGRIPARAYSELQLAPLAAQCWTVCVKHGRGFVRTGSEAGFVFDAADAGPPAEISVALHAAEDAPSAPHRIDLYGDRDSKIDLAAWQAAFGVPVQHVGEYTWDSFPAHAVCNLLVNEFAPPRGKHAGWAPFRPAIAVAAAGLVLYTIFSVGEWAWMNHRATALRTQATEAFKAAFPEVQTIVDPALQMQRLYDQQMRERGRLGQSDFLPLLAAVSDSVPRSSSYRSMNFEEGRLEFTVVLPDKRSADQVREALAHRGLTTTVRDSRPNASGLETSFSVRFGT